MTSSAVLICLLISMLQQFRIEDLSWMTGDWELTSGSTRIEEHWTGVAGGTLIGMGRTVAGNKPAFFEYLRIEVRPDGIYYVAHPRAQSPAPTSNLSGCRPGK